MPPTSQQAMNEFLSNPDAEPPAQTGSTAASGAASEAGADARAGAADGTESEVPASATGPIPVPGATSGHHGSSISGAPSARGSDYDYEMQDYRPTPFTTRTSRARSNTPYIPHYMMAQGHQFPVQEVVPNSQMAIATGVDPNASRSHMDSMRGNMRSRTQTVTSNVLNPEEARPSRSTTRPGSHVSDGAGSKHGSEEDVSHEDHGDSEEHALNVPLMVKPKTLYQNPQTPTVLPSTYHPINKWSSLKHGYLKEFLAEFMGTMVLIVFGTAVTCQVNTAAKIQQDGFDQALAQLTNTPGGLVQTAETFKELVSSTSGGTFDDVALGWAAASVMGYFAAGGSAISGAHLNPSMTVSNFIFRGFPFKKIVNYIAGQLLGAFAGALILYIFYKRVIEEAFPHEWWKTESVASMFCVFPKAYLSTARQFVSEYICTAMLQVGIFALTDPYTCLSSELFPLMLFILIYIVNASMSYQTGCAMNMARDLGPRLALYAVGFNRHLLWIKHKHFFWVPIVAPFLGSITGGLIYDICIYQGHESPVNWPLATYRDIIYSMWLKRPDWSRRPWRRSNEKDSGSDFNSFSYEEDEDEPAPYQQENLPKLSMSDSGNPELQERPQSVQFKSVQSRTKRHFGGIPPITEEDPSLDGASLAGTSISLVGSANDFDTSTAAAPGSQPAEDLFSSGATQKKQE
ncbi:related to Glycerol uptake/efflux facilitator protein [Zygosaccharomyces bailii]|nr:related to Glycerol uptake/efflux facilitator protein [Zygosaccharomyces bailii]